LLPESPNTESEPAAKVAVVAALACGLATRAAAALRTIPASSPSRVVPRLFSRLACIMVTPRGVVGLSESLMPPWTPPSRIYSRDAGGSRLLAARSTHGGKVVQLPLELVEAPLHQLAVAEVVAYALGFVVTRRPCDERRRDRGGDDRDERGALEHHGGADE